MIDANLIEDLVRAGVAPDLVGRVAHMMVEAETLVMSRDILERRRTAERERQQNRRKIAKETGLKAKPKRADCHVMSQDSHVTPDRFEELWAVYPKRGGASNPKKPARDKFERAVKSGVDPLEIIAAAMRYRDIEQKAGRAGTEKIAQMVTWLNQQRWIDYQSVVPELPLELTHGCKLPTGVYVKADTPEWDAWCSYLRQHGKKTPPRDKSGGWRFDTLWPPRNDSEMTAGEKIL